MNRIAQFEALAERLVEGTFAQLFGGRISAQKVATRLGRAMEDNRICSSGSTMQAPTHYRVYLSPSDHETLSAEQPSLEDELAQHVTELASQAGFVIHGSPVVQVLPDEELAARDLRVDAGFQAAEMEDVGSTRGMEASDASEQEKVASEPPKGRPFLILDGRRHVNIRLPVVSIGRALDNDVIIEDPRVSRHHAQLRQRYGHYVLYDLDSSGGTQINGYPVEECVLHSGDVVSFAGVKVIYGEDPPTPIPLPEGDDTEPFETLDTELEG